MKPKTQPAPLLLVLALWAAIESQNAGAVEIEPMGKALQALLGTPKVSKRGANLFYAKDAQGKPSAAAFVEKGTYEPNCSHTWAIGINPSDGRVTQVRVVEMSCPHAFPTKAASFLDQFKGKGPADVATLAVGRGISGVAKATGSAELATAAVKRSIEAWQKMKGAL